MLEAIEFIVNYWRVIMGVLDLYQFNLGHGINVTLLELLIGFVLISMVITIYWKGAKG